MPSKANKKANKSSTANGSENSTAFNQKSKIKAGTKANKSSAANGSKNSMAFNQKAKIEADKAKIEAEKKAKRNAIKEAEKRKAEKREAEKREAKWREAKWREAEKQKDSNTTTSNSTPIDVNKLSWKERREYNRRLKQKLISKEKSDKDTTNFNTFSDTKADNIRHKEIIRMNEERLKAMDNRSWFERLFSCFF
jgi:hypothetical protein